MADRTITERLQPSLLDRLTDQEPGKGSDGRRTRVIDVARLREIVKRDLSWLLNSNNLETMIDPKTMPNVAASVLNYGVREVSGDFASASRAREIRRAMIAAIARFEPRIIAGSLQLSEQSIGRRGAMIIFDIRADLWAQPLPMELYLRSHIDLASGELRLEQGD